jgi:molybdopterin/thiamine biosynthesis adenylyltransferase
MERPVTAQTSILDPVNAPSSPGQQTEALGVSERYSRQILFPGIGAAGQSLLALSHVVIVGVGATGAASASLLARSGVGRLTLIDRDFVEASNLQRQILFDEADAAESLPKAEAARRKIALFNSSVRVDAVIADLVPDNIHSLLGDAHLILDCTDNFETRFLLNDYAVQQTKPWIYAAAVGAYAAAMNILPEPAPDHTIEYEPTACLACLFPAPPSGVIETCDTAGILGSAVNLAASIQTTEALKFLTQQPSRMRRTLLSWDLWSGERSEVSASVSQPACAVCHGRNFAHLLGSVRPHITLCGRNAVQIHEHNRTVDLAALRERLSQHPDLEDLRANPMLLRFRRGLLTLSVFPDGRALIQGTTDRAVARALYARFLGS